jgi:hypothetical protein
MIVSSVIHGLSFDRTSSSVREVALDRKHCALENGYKLHGLELSGLRLTEYKGVDISPQDNVGRSRQNN